MRRITGLLFLAAAPLPGVLLALADMRLGLQGHAVYVFVACCVVVAVLLGAIASAGLVTSALRHTRATSRIAVPVAAGAEG